MKLLSTALIFVLAMCQACSGPEDKGERQETTQERIGREAVEQIQATLNSAEQARELQEQHAKEIEEGVKLQDGGGS